MKKNKKNKEKTFKVCITETLQRVVEVKAANAGHAIDKVFDMYSSEKIVLYPEDYVDTDFNIYED